MKKRIINWIWEDEEAQKSFEKWQGFPDREETKVELDKIEKLVSINSNMKILDVGCGTGRQSLEMARRGHEVVGIDVAQRYLNKAIESAKTEALNIEFRLERGCELTEIIEYDLVIAYYHTLGFMSNEELKEHLKNICRSIKPEGKFLLRTAGPQIKPDTVADKIKNWAEDDGKYILSEKYIEDGYRIENCIMIDSEKDEIVEYREKQKAFSLNDILTLLREAGFKDIKAYSDINGNIANEYEFGVYVCTK